MQVHVPQYNTHNGTHITKDTHWSCATNTPAYTTHRSPCLHTQQPPCPTTHTHWHMAPRTTPIHCATPAHDPTCLTHAITHANSHADTPHMASCTWDLQAPLPFAFPYQRCCQVPGEGAAALPRPAEGSFFSGSPTLSTQTPSSLTFYLVSKGPLRAGIRV